MTETGFPSIITSRLQELTNRHPELALVVDYYQQRTILFENIQKRIPQLDLSPSYLIERLELKQVLFKGVDLPYSPDLMEELFIGLCQASCAKDFQKLIEDRSLDLDELLRTALNRDSDGFTRLARQYKIDAILLAMLAQDCLKPALMAWVNQYNPIVDLSEWQNPVCPFCGSLPGLVEIRGTRGECHLRCTRCGADWPCRQMACGLCGNDDYHSLGVLSIEGENDKYRVKTCDVCNGYLKAIVTYEPTPPLLLAFEDLVTLHLDVVAQDRGYRTIPNLELISG